MAQFFWADYVQIWHTSWVSKKECSWLLVDILLEVYKLYKLKRGKKRNKVLEARLPKTEIWCLNISCFLLSLDMWSRLCYYFSLSCVVSVCVCESDGKDRLCTTSFARVICDANASKSACHMLVHVMQTSGEGVWVWLEVLTASAWCHTSHQSTSQSAPHP